MFLFTSFPLSRTTRKKYTMNIVVLQGTLSSEPIERTLPSGTTIADWKVTTEVDGKNVSVPVQWTEPNRSVQQFGKGDSVVVVGSIRQRFFQAKGMLASRTEVVGKQVTKPTQKVPTAKMLTATRETIGPL